MLQWNRGSIVVKVLCYSGTAVAQWLRCCATNQKVEMLRVFGDESEKVLVHITGGTVVAQWLGCCATVGPR